MATPDDSMKKGRDLLKEGALGHALENLERGAG
jgi:hypothetical protein